MRRLNGFGLLVPRDVTTGQRSQAPAAQSGPAAPRAALSISELGRQAETFFKSHAGRSLAIPDGPVYQQGSPWTDPPPGFQEFYTPGIIATPLIGAGDTVAITITVPQGWDGVIKKLANWYSGGGFINGSGDMIWRLFRNGQPFKNFDAITIFWGSPAAPFDFGRGGLLVQSGDVITGVVNNVAAIAPATLSGWFVGGYVYPRQS